MIAWNENSETEVHMHLSSVELDPVASTIEIVNPLKR